MWCTWLLSLATDNVILAGVIGTAVSVIAEFWSGWNDLPFETKRWLVLAICLAFPIGSLLLGVFVFACAGMVLTAASFVQALFVGCLAFSTSQIVHLWMRKK